MEQRQTIYLIAWVIHGCESEPIEEELGFGDLNALVLWSQRMFSIMRERHSATPPDGFLVFDSDGREVRRWFRAPPTRKSIH